MDVDADIEELQTLLSSAKRPRVQRLLQAEIDVLSKARSEIAATPPAVREPVSSVSSPATPPSSTETPSQKNLPGGPILLAKSAAPPPVTYSPLTSFAWDQEGDRVKVYLSIEGASKESVEADFSNQSFDVRIHLEGSGGKPQKHLRCGFPKLHAEIDPSQSRVVVKPKRIVVSLKKKDKKHWLDLQFKEDKFKSKTSTENKDNPMTGIMDMMKTLYDDGDDNMKRNIAEAWSKSKSSTDGTGALGGGLGGGADFP